MSRFIQLEQRELERRRYLEPGDVCGYLGEYYSGSGFSGPYNRLISNIKIDVDQKHRLHYKEEAIRQVARALLENFGERLLNYTFIPVPPSKSQADLLYDNRLLRVLEHCSRHLQQSLDVRDLLRQEISIPKARLAAPGQRLTPEDYERIWQVDTSQLTPPPSRIVIFDDVLTRGAHFRAAKRLLKTVVDCEIFGLFIAKTMYQFERTGQ